MVFIGLCRASWREWAKRWTAVSNLILWYARTLNLLALKTFNLESRSEETI